MLNSLDFAIFPSSYSMSAKKQKYLSSDLSRYEFERVARLLTESSSRLEDTALEVRLDAMCREALDMGDDTELEAALSLLKDDQIPAYEQLLSMAEDCAQSHTNGTETSILMLIPILTWSRYKNFTGVVEDEILIELAESVRRHIAGPKARVAMGNVMFSSDNIPESLTAVRSWLKSISAGGAVADIRSKITKPTVNDFADSRYLACTITAENPADLFRSPNETVMERARGQMLFCLDAHDLLEMPMIGSVFEVQPPSAFFTAWRQSESSMRIWSLKSLVDFAAGMGHTAGDITACVALFVPGAKAAPDAMAEIRVGICPKDDPKRVVSGIAWPVLPEEFEQAEVLAADVLTHKGVKNILVHPQSFPLEWCDQCGAPLYANVDGMVVHIDFSETDTEKELPPTLN